MNEELTGVQIYLYKLNKHDMIFTNEGVTDGYFHLTDHHPGRYAWSVSSW